MLAGLSVFTFLGFSQSHSEIFSFSALSLFPSSLIVPTSVTCPWLSCSNLTCVQSITISSCVFKFHLWPLTGLALVMTLATILCWRTFLKRLLTISIPSTVRLLMGFFFWTFRFLSAQFLLKPVSFLCICIFFSVKSDICSTGSTALWFLAHAKLSSSKIKDDKWVP